MSNQNEHLQNKERHEYITKQKVEPCKSKTELCDVNHKKLISDDCKINKFINDRFVRE